MNVLDAALNTASEYPHGGADALSLRMGKSNLSDELNPRNKAKFGLADSVRLQQLTGDHRILYAMASELGEMCVPLPQVPDEAGDLCASKVAAVAMDFGKLMCEVSEDLRDGQISDNELAQIEAAWGLLISRGQNMLKQLTLMNEQLHASRQA